MRPPYLTASSCPPTMCRCAPSEGWWQEFFARSLTLMPQLNGQQYANITWALYK